MTALPRVRRTRRRLALLGGVRALAWAGTALFVILAGGRLLDVEPLRIVAATAAAGTLAALLWRDRFVTSDRRVALWLEERVPELRYALVTAIDPRHAAALSPTVEPLLARVDAAPLMRRAALGSVLLPVAAVSLAALAFVAIPERIAGSAGSDAAPVVRAGEAPSRLEPLAGRITPPRYALEAGVGPRDLAEPTTITGLAGSTVELTGPGAHDGLGVQLGDSALSAQPAGDGELQWRVAFTMPDSAAALRIADREHRRLIVLAPVRDRRPTAQLLTPARDTTMRAAHGSLVLEARLTDDIGLASAHFEYIVASGETEGSFTARDGVLGARAIVEPGVRDQRIRVSVPFASFALEPGDQLTVRAVVLDGNDRDGPGIGYSEPRTLRIARPSDYDSLAVDPAPPPADSMQMSLRYLIQLTERLEASRGEQERQIFVDSSRSLGTRAERLRVRVQQLQSDHTMGGRFSPDPLLATAYLSLTQGEFALKVAEPGESVPHLWDALHALQQYAWAERYYLRGRSPDVLVDLARVRLTGDETGHASARAPRGLADTTRVRLRRAYADAVDLLATAPDGARERLALLQVEALRAQPELADALGAAVRALQAGGDAAAGLERARRILDGGAVVADTLPRWSGGW